MTKNYQQVKNRSSKKPFLLLPREMITSDAYYNLSSSAIKLLICLGAQYYGTNNGDLTTAWTIMRERGWHSKQTLQKAMNELEDAGFILRTRQGGRNKCNLFALTWISIDECGGKLDVNSTRIASNAWKLDPLVQLSGQPITKTVPMKDNSK